jgi:hypothetical protein
MAVEAYFEEKFRAVRTEHTPYAADVHGAVIAVLLLVALIGLSLMVLGVK